MRQLNRRFGELPSEAVSSIEALSSPDLERIAEAVWNVNTPEDLLNWLQDNSN